MVIINFKLSEAGSVSLHLDTPEQLEKVLQQCAAKVGTELGGYIAIRNGRVVTGDALVGNEDEIDIFPAISGG